MNWETRLSNGEAPAYLVHGEETLLNRDAVDWLRDRVLSGGIEDFNLDRFDGQEGFDAERVIQSALTLPMMAPKRFVWVRNAQLIFSRSKDALKPILEYLDGPDPTTCLVFEANATIKKNTVLYKRLNKCGVVYQTVTPRERELPSWSQNRARMIGRRLSDSAANALAECIGSDLAGLAQAIERLSLYVPQEQTIEESHVRETIAHTRTHSVWDLVDGVAGRDVGRALYEAHQLLDGGQAPLQLLSLVIRQFRQLLIGADVRRGGGSLSQAAESAGVPRFRERQFDRQLGSYTFDELVRALERLEDTDRALKGSKLPNDMIFEAMILDLCAPRSS